MKRFYLSILMTILCFPPFAIAQFVPLAELSNLPNAIPLDKTQGIKVNTPPISTLSTAEEAPEGGSKTIASFLQHLTPSVDTRIPESPTQAAHRINALINAGQYDKALSELAKLKHNDASTLDIDVQLLFLEGRAYAAKGDTIKALDIYRNMTIKYPELPEPWNNMAILQMQAGSLDEALSSLQTALSINPDYATANKNIALIYMKLAKQSLGKASH